MSELLPVSYTHLDVYKRQVPDLLVPDIAIVPTHSRNLGHFYLPRCLERFYVATDRLNR